MVNYDLLTVKAPQILWQLTTTHGKNRIAFGEVFQTNHRKSSALIISRFRTVTFNSYICWFGAFLNSVKQFPLLNEDFLLGNAAVLQLQTQFVRNCSETELLPATESERRTKRLVTGTVADIYRLLRNERALTRLVPKKPWGVNLPSSIINVKLTKINKLMDVVNDCLL